MPRRAVGRPSDRLVLLSSCDGRAGRSFRWQRAAGDPVTAPAFDPSARGGGPTSGPSRRRGGFAPSAWGQRGSAGPSSRSARRKGWRGRGRWDQHPARILEPRPGGPRTRPWNTRRTPPGPAGAVRTLDPALEHAEDPVTVAGSRDVAFAVAVAVVLES